MKILNIKIEDLKPYEKNPRRNDETVKSLVNSIKEFGFKVPIIIDKNNVIVSGHTRYKAAKELNLKEIPCIIADDLSDEQVKAFRLVDNKVAEKSDWDFDLLDKELENIFNINMSIFDFDLSEEINAYEEWKDMPEFEQENKEGYQKIVIHFDTKEDVKEFEKLIKQKITNKTKSIWFPEQHKENLKDIAYE